MRKLVLMLLCTLVPSLLAHAAPKAEQKVIRLTLTPRATTQPALKLRFMPSPADMVGGDAAPLYIMAIDWVQGVRERNDKNFDRWLDEPLSQLHPGEIPFKGAAETWVHVAKAAGLRKECDWPALIKEDGFAALLPYLNNTRELANVLAIQSRDAMVRDKPEEAVELLGIMYTLTSRLNSKACIVQALVGAGCAQLASARVEELVQLPDCPNLYWALADIPHPLIDAHGAVAMDMQGLISSFPALLRVRNGEISLQEFRQTIGTLNELWKVTGKEDRGSVASHMESALLMVRLYPLAKKHLASKGMTPQQIDAMPVHQALAIYMLDEYEVWSDELSKWTLLPWPQADAGLRRAEEQLQKAISSSNASPMMRFVPAVRRAVNRMVMADRKIASLQCVEAVRAYAATHDGHPPQKLEDIADTPAPIDPMTGHPFDYQLKGGTVIINVPAPDPGEEHLGWRYEITFRQ